MHNQDEYVKINMKLLDFLLLIMILAGMVAVAASL